MKTLENRQKARTSAGIGSESLETGHLNVNLPDPTVQNQGISTSNEGAIINQRRSHSRRIIGTNRRRQR